MTNSNPTPKPIPVPVPRAEATSLSTPAPDKAAVEAAKWGRVDESGNVWLRTSSGERVVGQYAAGGTTQDALSFYVRRYLDLAAQVSLLETRVAKISPEEARKSLKKLQAELVEPAVVGDVEALLARTTALTDAIEARAVEVAARRAEAKAQALVERTAIVETAEALAKQDPQATHWRDSRSKFTELLEKWQQAQKHGARLDRATEDELWKRFSNARTQFDRHLRQHFSERDAKRKSALARKNELIEIAESLKTSTDWNATANQYRQLLEEWKKAGRTSHKEDDRLWEKFRAAQQYFFDARNSHNQELDIQFQENLTRKLELLAQAEALLPITDLAHAKEQFRTIGQQWDEIGRVPRADISRTEGRLREIEREIREFENKQWADSDPAKQERSSGMAAQLAVLIEDLEAKLAQTTDPKQKAELTEALEARKAWLAAVLED